MLLMNEDNHHSIRPIIIIGLHYTEFKYRPNRLIFSQTIEMIGAYRPMEPAAGCVGVNLAWSMEQIAVPVCSVLGLYSCHHNSMMVCRFNFNEQYKKYRAPLAIKFGDRFPCGPKLQLMVHGVQSTGWQQMLKMLLQQNPGVSALSKASKNCCNLLGLIP